jgi:hypothetical protein
LNEGLAQYFEECLWTGDRFLINQVPARRVRQLHADMKAKRLFDFPRLFALTPEDWAQQLADDRMAGGVLYNQSWAMVQFLVHGGEEQGKALYRSHLIEMLKLINDSKDYETAFRIAFAGNVKGFQDRFVTFARQMSPGGESVLIEHQNVLADMLVHLHNEKTSFKDIASFRKATVEQGYRIQYSRKDMQWVSEPDPSVYFKNLDGELYAADELFFEAGSGSPLPDMVCRAFNGAQLRTRFHRSPSGIEYEVLIEPRR